jgi:hypothetical protein
VGVGGALARVGRGKGLGDFGGEFEGRDPLHGLEFDCLAEGIAGRFAGTRVRCHAPRLGDYRSDIDSVHHTRWIIILRLL